MTRELSGGRVAMLDCPLFNSEAKSRMAKHILATALVILISVTSAHADSNDERLGRLRALYQCPIFTYLAAIHRNHTAPEQNQFLIIELSYPRDHRFYTQCAFFDDSRQIHCEAGSPFYDDRLKDYFTAERLATLAALGYTTETSSKNFYWERPVADLKSLYDIAGILIETMGRVFDMQLDE